MRALISDSRYAEVGVTASVRVDEHDIQRC